MLNVDTLNGQNPHQSRQCQLLFHAVVASPLSLSAPPQVVAFCEISAFSLYAATPSLQSALLHSSLKLHAMTKKGITKAAARMKENPAVEQIKASSTLKKPGNEIDEIFSGKKKKKTEQEKTEKANGDLSVKAKVMKKKKKKKEAGIRDPPSQPRRRIEDGLSIYTEEELGLGKADAGSTPLCPFDCECCF